MQTSWETSPTLVIDASIAVWLVTPFIAAIDPTPTFRLWYDRGVSLHAPALWLAEITSSVRRCVHADLLSPAQGLTALEDMLALEVNLAPITPNRCRAAFAWAEKLGQARAYDSFYLALAEELETTLITADKRLANSARQQGLSWVRWIGDP